MTSHNYAVAVNKVAGNRTDFINGKDANRSPPQAYWTNAWLATGFYQTNWSTSTGWIVGSSSSVPFDTGFKIPYGVDHNGTAYSTKVRLYYTASKYIEKDLGSVNQAFGFFDIPRWLLEGSTPTYLETLDKLDQWSSAQYIPNSRNILNL